MNVVPVMGDVAELEADAPVLEDFGGKMLGVDENTDEDGWILDVEPGAD